MVAYLVSQQSNFGRRENTLWLLLYVQWHPFNEVTSVSHCDMGNKTTEHLSPAGGLPWKD